MGIFNELSYSHPFVRGIQGAPGVGFSLTSDGNYDMVGKKTKKCWCSGIQHRRGNKEIY